MTDMLSARLAKLRVPPPPGDFERRLEQALWREAQVMRAERTSARGARPSRVRRWSGRLGVSLAITLGASAAAAAAGWYAWAPTADVSSSPPPAAPTREEEAARRQPRRATPAPAAELELVQPPIIAELPAAAEPRRAATVTRAAPPERSARSTVQRSAPERRATAAARSGTEALPAIERLELPSEAPALASADAHGTAAQDNSRRPGSSSLEPLAMPEPARGKGREGRGRALPDVDRRPERDARAERPERDRGATAPGRAIAAERSERPARDRAERGLERAQDARERRNAK